MDEADKTSSELNPADFPAFPPTDESGEVDLSLIDTMLSMTVAERLRWHDEMNEFIAIQRDIRIAKYGFDPAATD